MRIKIKIVNNRELVSAITNLLPMPTAPKCWKRLNCVGYLAQVGKGYILIVPEHRVAGMSHKLQFVLVGRIDVFEQGRKGMAAAVRRVPATLYAVSRYDGIVYAAGVQDRIKQRTVSLCPHPAA